MTIFHLIKYDIDKAVEQWLHTPLAWRDIFPHPIADRIIEVRKPGFEPEQLREVVRKVLAEYNGEEI